MLPDTEHPSILSVLQCENQTVINVLVDHVIDKSLPTESNILFE